jgi:curved DNA-binding protein CbpA
MDQLDLLDYYTLLEVADDAKSDAIRDAFYRFARKFHPDRHAGATAEKVERATRIYQRGAEAYHVLSHPTLRGKYDVALKRGELRLPLGKV